MTETTDLPAATDATPFKGCHAVYGLHKDLLEGQDLEEGKKLLAAQVQIFKDQHPKAEWVSEATYAFTFTAEVEGKTQTVTRIEWEGVNFRFRGEPVDLEADSERDGEGGVTQST